MNQYNKKTMSNNENTIINQLVGSRTLRLATTCDSHYWFFHMYMSHYVNYPTADFQRGFFRISEAKDIKCAVLVAFRDSAKSTIMSLSYPIWAIIGQPQKKFVLLLSQTQNQAQKMLSNIKAELENNSLLRNDVGALEEETDRWGRDSLIIPKFNAQIMAASTEQSIRGIRHLQYRPDLIIADDVEDLNSVKSREGRDKTYQWFCSEVIPVGSQDAKIIVIGNLLHEDSLLMRLRQDIEIKRLNGIYRQCPLIDDSGVIMWPGRYPDMASIEQKRLTIPDKSAWLREFLLKIVPNTDRIVRQEWINYYDELPAGDNYKTAIGVDLAYTVTDKSDYTAIISARVYGSGKDAKIYLLPNIINKRLEYPGQVETIRSLVKTMSDSTIYLEKNGGQDLLVQQFKLEGIHAVGVHNSHDKGVRLTAVTHLLSSGQVVFPRQGAEILIQQLLGFGVESHDDLADALSLLLTQIMIHNKRKARAFEHNPFIDKWVKQGII